MAYDFPASPSPGDEYTPPVGGQTYIWQPPRWLVKGVPPAGGGGGGGITEAPTDGQLYGRMSAAWSVVPATVTWSTLTGKPSTFPPTVPIAWTDVSGKPSTFPPTLPIAQSDVTGLPAALTAKLDASAYTAADVLTKILTVDGTSSGLDADLLDGQNGTYYSSYANLTGKPATFPPTLPIAQSDVTGLPAALTGKEPVITLGTTAQYYRGDKNWTTLDKTAVGLANVDNTSDANKPVSTAQATAIALKADLAGPTFTGDPKAPTPTAGDNDTSIATTAFVTGAIATSAATKEPTIAGGTTAQYWRGDKSWQTLPAAGEPAIGAGTTAQYWRGDKSWQTLDKTAVGLANVDNTSDANKPVSTAQATADGLALPKAGGTMTGKLTTTASVTGNAGLTLTTGTGPSSPGEGDIWLNTGILSGRFGGGTKVFGMINQAQTWSAIQTYTVKPVMPTPASGTASIILPHGAAPSAPANGDLWTTTAGLYAQINGATVGPLAGVTDISSKADLAGPTFTGDPKAPTASPGDNDTSIATTAFVTAAIAAAVASAGAPVGSAITGPFTVTPTNYLKANGALVSRTTYAALWTFAQAQGTVSEAVWSAGSQGRFSVGGGSTDFRLPDVRGDFIRGFDDARGADSGRATGTLQAEDLNAHGHPGSTASAEPSHSHTSQGYISTGGSTAGLVRTAAGATPAAFSSGLTQQSTPTITIALSAGSETRPRNVAWPWFIKYQ